MHNISIVDVNTYITSFLLTLSHYFYEVRQINAINMINTLKVLITKWRYLKRLNFVYNHVELNKLRVFNYYNKPQTPYFRSIISIFDTR